MAQSARRALCRIVGPVGYYVWILVVQVVARVMVVVIVMVVGRSGKVVVPKGVSRVQLGGCGGQVDWYSRRLEGTGRGPSAVLHGGQKSLIFHHRHAVGIKMMFSQLSWFSTV